MRKIRAESISKLGSYVDGASGVVSMRYYIPPKKGDLSAEKPASVYPTLSVTNKDWDIRIQKWHEASDIILQGPLPPMKIPDNWRWFVITKETMLEAGKALANMVVNDTPIFALTEEEILKLRVHFTVPEGTNITPQEVLPITPPKPGDLDLSRAVNLIECAAVTPASKNALAAKTARAFTPANRRPSVMLDEPPLRGFGMTAGCDCTGVVALFDSGAGVSMIEAHVMTEIGAKLIRLPPAQMKLIISADGEPMSLLGYVHACLVIGRGIYPHNFYVRTRPVDRIKRPYDVIVGVDLMAKIGVISVNYEHKTLTLKDPKIRSEYVFRLDPKEPRVVIRTSQGKKWKMGNSKSLAEVIRDAHNQTQPTVSGETSRRRETPALTDLSDSEDDTPPIPRRRIIEGTSATPHHKKVAGRTNQPAASVPSKPKIVTPSTASVTVRAPPPPPSKTPVPERNRSTTPPPPARKQPPAPRKDHKLTEEQIRASRLQDLPYEIRIKEMARRVKSAQMQKKTNQEPRPSTSSARPSQTASRGVSMVDVLSELFDQPEVEDSTEVLNYQESDSTEVWNEDDFVSELLSEADPLNYLGFYPTGQG
jgi:hypothetical protein